MTPQAVISWLIVRIVEKASIVANVDIGLRQILLELAAVSVVYPIAACIRTSVLR